MQTGIYTDPRDLQVYRTITLGQTTWLAENLSFDTHKVGQLCWAYDHNPRNVQAHGLLYTWDVAKKACPPGWRLPTKEEWQTWTQHLCAENFNGVYSTHGEFLGMGTRSMYWTSEGMEHSAWAQVFRHHLTVDSVEKRKDQIMIDTRHAVSVRCVLEKYPHR